MFRAVLTARPKLVHFHDPELIPIALLLRLSGIKVIYDVHEDLPRQILSKPWIPTMLRRPLALVAGLVERLAALGSHAIVAATPTIADRFPVRKTYLVQNYPIVTELQDADSTPMTRRPAVAAYVGAITAIRGAREMIEALSLMPPELDLRLAIAGQFSSASLREELASLEGWARVEEHGWLSRGEVARLLHGARMGLVLFHPVANHIEAQPTKLFEYMSAGLPVIASDFPLWRDIVGDARCGILVDPLDPAAIADAMTWIMRNPEEAQEMGLRGRKAVEERFNWHSEARNLIRAYQLMKL